MSFTEAVTHPQRQTRNEFLFHPANALIREDNLPAFLERPPAGDVCNASLEIGKRHW